MPPSEARALVDQFHDMIRKKDEAKLDVWIANAKRSLVSSFATGVLKDRAAVRAAIGRLNRPHPEKTVAVA